MKLYWIKTHGDKQREHRGEFLPLGDLVLGFAVEGTPFFIHHNWGEWNVSHEPSGQSAGHCFSTFQFAELWAITLYEKIEEFGLAEEWEGPKPDTEGLKNRWGADPLFAARFEFQERSK